jgi:hypothetical protein
MKTLLPCLLTLMALLAHAPAFGGEPAVEPQTAFNRLKGLAGEWQAAMPGQKEPVTVTYRVTSGGNVVMETIMPNTGHEMVTLYHLDSGRLVLTHYCALGNQPKMALVPKRSTPEDLVFDFVGGSNVKPKKDPHMHALRLRFENPDRMIAEWDFFKGGKKESTEKFVLSRKVG